MFIFITHAKDSLNKLHFNLGRRVDREYIDYLKNIEAAAFHSTQIYHDTLVDVVENLNAEEFNEKWEQDITNALHELKRNAANVTSRINLMERSIFDDFKEAQYTDHKSVSLRARKLVEYVLKHDFITPIEETVNETMEWVGDEIDDTIEIINNEISIPELLKNSASKAADMPQLSPGIASLKNQLLEAEKNKLRMLNQVRERTNALADKFSLNAVTRWGTVYKKFIR